MTKKLWDKNLKRILMLLVILTMLIFAKSISAKADIAKGTWGTCAWNIDADGNMTIGEGTGASVNSCPWTQYKDSILSIKSTGKVILPNGCKYLFCGLSKATAIDLSSCDAKNAVDMMSMFSDCTALKSLNISGWHTPKAETMKYMFSSCPNLSSLDLSGFDTSNVEDMRNMFFGCTALTSLDLSNFNTGNVKTMKGMFYGCTKLSSLSVKNFNTENVSDMEGMFYGCSSITSLDLGSFNTAKVSSMYCMFKGCSKLSTLDISSFNAQSAVNLGGMFNGCGALASLDLRNFNTGSAVYMNDIFSNCASIKSLNLSAFNTENTTTMSEMFSGCTNLTSLSLLNFNTKKVQNMAHMFDGCKSIRSIEFSKLFNTENATDMTSMFYNCSSLSSLYLPGFNTKNTKNMYCMFKSCNSLTSLDVSFFDTSNVSNMQGMFENCPSLKKLKLGAKSGLIDTSGITSALKYISPTAKSASDGVTYTGKWTKASPYNHADAISGADLEAKYATNGADFGSFDATTWVWEASGNNAYCQMYQSDDGITDGKPNVVDISSDVPVDEQINSFAQAKGGGKTGYWTKLDDGTWTYTFYVFKADVPWSVYEDALPGYSGDHMEDNRIVIPDGSKEAVITNTADSVAKQKYGSLKLTKEVVSDEDTASSSDTFSFKITLTDETDSPVSGIRMFGGVPFSNGSADVSVKAGESITLSKIPVGYHFRISEIPKAGYRSYTFVNDGGVIDEGETSAVCTNKYIKSREDQPDDPVKETVDLVIRKHCEEAGNFAFDINVSNLNADETVDVKTKKSGAADAEEENTSYTPDRTGEINISASLSDGGAITVSNIPVGAKYRVSEEASDFLASYKVSDANTKGGIKQEEDTNDDIEWPLATQVETADSGEAVSIDFTNRRKFYDVSITKRDENDDFVDGAVLQVLSSDGTIKALWTTVSGENETVSLAPGEYTLHEVSAPNGYSVAKDIRFIITPDGKTIVSGIETDDIEMIDKNTAKTVSIKKVDDAGFPVPGAQLSITDDETGTAAYTWSTDNRAYDVVLSFGKNYTLSEVGVPEGYAKAVDIKISVSSDGKLSVDGKETTDNVITMVDSAKKTASIKKTDTNGNFVIGAELTLFNEETNTAIASWETADEVKEIQLQAGKTYILSETKVPMGYVKADDIRISISDEGKLLINGTPSDSGIVEMVDVPKPYILPSTGGRGGFPLLFLLFSISFSLAFLFLALPQRDDNRRR